MIVLSLLLALSAAPAIAHEGHDHGDDKQAAPAAASVAPRFEARTDVFELVGVLAGGDLVLYLDRAGNNAPVDNAELEIESGTLKATAQRIAAGTYRIKAGPLAAPGKHALTISATAGEDSDLLTASFEHAPAVAAAATQREPAWPWAAGGGALAAAIVAIVATVATLAIRRRRKK